MERKGPPLILVTNDDGIHSEGIKILSDALKDLGQVVTVAPESEKSAVSHALTMHRPLRVEKVAPNTYTVNGTPTDCVVIGVEKILQRKPDLLVSGINRGANLGDDITYSGTVSAAMEGTLLGIPSIAVSLVINNGIKPDFTTAANYAKMIARVVLERGLPEDTLLNVNIPALQSDKIKGIRFTRQGKRTYDNAIQETFDPWNRRHYWIGGGTPSWEGRNDTDIQAVVQGYVSITPIHLDLTNYEALKRLQREWTDL